MSIDFRARLKQHLLETMSIFHSVENDRAGQNLARLSHIERDRAGVNLTAGLKLLRWISGSRFKSEEVQPRRNPWETVGPNTSPQRKRFKHHSGFLSWNCLPEEQVPLLLSTAAPILPVGLD